mgnify:CR=1 FL=1
METRWRRRTDPTRPRARCSNDFDIIMRFWDCPKLTVAAVHRYCLGSAMELALACDLTISRRTTASSARPEVRFGSGIVAMLAAVARRPEAREVSCCSRGDDKRDRARRRCDMGLVNRGRARRRRCRAALALRASASLRNDCARGLSSRSRRSTAASTSPACARRCGTRSNSTCRSRRRETRRRSREFNAILQRDGAKAAIAWRSARAAQRHPRETER